MESVSANGNVDGNVGKRFRERTLSRRGDLSRSPISAWTVSLDLRIDRAKIASYVKRHPANRC